MKTLLNEAEVIEQYHFNRLPADEHLLFQAKLILDTNLLDNLKWQKLTYEVIKVNGRKKLRAEITIIHDRLFLENRFSTFKESIRSLFKSQS